MGSLAPPCVLANHVGGERRLADPHPALIDTEKDR